MLWLSIENRIEHVSSHKIVCIELISGQYYKPIRLKEEKNNQEQSVERRTKNQSSRAKRMKSMQEALFS